MEKMEIKDCKEDVYKRCISTSPYESSDEIEEVTEDLEITWGENDGNLNQFLYNPYNDIVGINPDLIDCLSKSDSSALDFYELLVDNDVIDTIVTSTNNYLTKNIYDIEPVESVTSTNRNEIRKFIGILLYMGLNDLPSLRHYWLTDDMYFSRISSVLPYDRFMLLLENVYFFDKKIPLPTNHPLKIDEFITIMTGKFNQWYNPKENISLEKGFGGCVERQTKKNTTSLVVVKAITEPYYTLNLKIFYGKKAEKMKGFVPANVTIDLIQNYLDLGRCVYANSLFTSVELAHKLNDRQTHLIGYVKPSRRGNPVESRPIKLLLDTVYHNILKSSTNVLFVRFYFKRDICMLATTADDHMVFESSKPTMLVEYLNVKKRGKYSDRHSNFHNVLERSTKWYRRIAFELLLNTAVVNAWILFTEVKKKNITLTRFREMLVRGLLYDTPQNTFDVQEVMNRHTILKTKVRNRCTHCYKLLAAAKGRVHAISFTKKVATKCSVCCKYFCYNCFLKIHVP